MARARMRRMRNEIFLFIAIKFMQTVLRLNAVVIQGLSM